MTTTTTNIEGRLQFPDQSPLNVTTQVSLNNGEYLTYSRIDGSFIFYDIPPGVHQLDVHSMTYHFGQIKILLVEDSMDVPKCLEYSYPGATKQPVKYPLVMTTYATYDYFEPKRGFSLFGILKNPMVLMMLVSVGLMLGMPKLMEGLDPEEKEEMRRQMKAQSNPTEMLSQMFSGGGVAGGTSALDDGKTRKERRRAKKD